MPLEQKIAKADILVDNGGSLDDLKSLICDVII